jgi:hypothetical protein
VVGKEVNLSTVVIWQAFKNDIPGPFLGNASAPFVPNLMFFDFFLPPDLAEAFTSDPASISVQLGGVTLPPPPGI